MCFRTQSFQHPTILFLLGLGALEEPNRERAGFLIMPKRPYEWRVDTHGCYKYDNAALGCGPRDQTAHLVVFLHLRTTNLPGPDSISCAVNMRNKEGLSADISNTVSHWGPVFRTTLTLGLLLQVCVCLCLCLFVCGVCVCVCVCQGECVCSCACT